jgi:hypothetical protein
MCTNGVEGLNCAIKAAIVPQHRTTRFVTSSLAEFIWKRQNKGRLSDEFIKALAASLDKDIQRVDF